MRTLSTSERRAYPKVLLPVLMLIALTVLAALPPSAKAQVASAQPQRLSFDGTRGTLWLSADAEVQRNGNDVTLTSGTLVWAHPAASASLSVGSVNLTLAGGGVVGLDANDGAADVYLGRGTASVAGSSTPLLPGRRYGGTSDEAPSLTSWYGSDTLEPRVPGQAGQPAGFMGVLEVAIDGKPEPLVLDPRKVEIDMDVSAAAARVTATLHFDPSAAGPGQRLAVFQAFLDDRALLHDITIKTADDTWTSVVAETSARGRPALAAEIPPADFASPLMRRAPFGIFLDTQRPLEVVLEFTQPLEIGERASVLRFPAVGDCYGRVIEDLVVTARGSDDVLQRIHSRLPLAADGGALEGVAANRPLEPGFSLQIDAREGKRNFAGRSPALDYVHFAAELQRDPLKLHEPSDVILLLDESGSMAGQPLEHARNSALALVGGLQDTDRVAVVRFGATIEKTEFASADLTLVSSLQNTFAGKGVGGTSRIDLALAAVRELIASRSGERNVQLVYLGDGNPTMTTLDSVEDHLEELAQLSVNALIGRISYSSSSATADYLSSEWSVPTFAISPGAEPAITAARALGQFGQPLTAVPLWRGDDDQTSQVTVWTPPTGWWGSATFLAGRYQSVRPLFDLPGRASVCADTVECPLVLDLTTAEDTEALAPIRVAAALRRSLTTDTPNPLDAAVVEQAGILGPDLLLEVPELRAEFELEYFRRRGRGAAEVNWINYDGFILHPPGGRILVDEAASATALPPVSDRAGNGTRLGIMPLERDPWLRSAEPSVQKSPPSINEVMTGSRSTTGTVRTSNSIPAPQSRAIQITSTALTSARYSALNELRSQVRSGGGTTNADIEEFVRAWHEVSLGSMSELQNVVNEYYALSLYNEATLASHDLSISDPYQHGSMAQKNAIEYFIEQKKWPRAERALRRGLNAFPSDDFYAEGLITVLRKTGRKSEIAELEVQRLEQQLSRNPDDVDALERLLTKLVEAGRRSMAEDALQRWTRKTGRSPTYFTLAAAVAEAGGNEEKSLTILRDGVEAFPDSRIARARLLDELVEAGQQDEALKVARKWSAVDPDNPWLALFIGDFYTRRQNHLEALSEYARIVEIAPESAVGYVKLGDAHYNLGDSKAATYAYDLALSVEPTHMASNLRIIESAAEAGDFERAKEAFTQLNQAGGTGDWDVAQARAETYYQLLSRWHAQAVYDGNDKKAEELMNQMMQAGVQAGPGYYGNQTYAIRLSFVPDTSRSDVLIDFRVTEPGGTTLSYISPYNNALNSQIVSNRGKSGFSPRIYLLPTVEEGEFEVEVELDGPSDHGPLTGKLYIHKSPRPFTEYWERHDIVLEGIGDSRRISFDATARPTGKHVAPEMSETNLAPLLEERSEDGESDDEDNGEQAP